MPRCVESIASVDNRMRRLAKHITLSFFPTYIHMQNLRTLFPIPSHSHWHDQIGPVVPGTPSTPSMVQTSNTHDIELHKRTSNWYLNSNIMYSRLILGWKLAYQHSWIFILLHNQQIEVMNLTQVEWSRLSSSWIKR